MKPIDNNKKRAYLEIVDKDQEMSAQPLTKTKRAPKGSKA
jgi:hypothetical protein